MKKLSGKYKIFRKMTEEQIQKWSQELIDILKQTIEKEAVHVEDYVEQLRKLNPGIGNEELSRKIISRRSLKAGGIGGICNLGGFITMPITMPVELYSCFRIQARMVLAIAYIYDWPTHDEDTATDILLVMGGNAGINALSKAGMKVGQELAKKAVKKFITREAMKKVNRIVSRKIITKAGKISLTSFMKLAPLIGAPIGAGFDYFGTLSIGKIAFKFYKG